MGDVASKLSHLLETKARIKESIIAKGVPVPDGTTFREYTGLIENIQTGSNITLQEKSVTPTKEQQIVEPDGQDAALSKVTVEPIPDEYTIPEGTREIIKNGVYDVKQYAEVDVDIPPPEGYIHPEGIANITENGLHNVNDYEYAQVNVPPPEGFIQPSGSKEITANGFHDVTEFASVEVNVPTESGDTTRVGPLYIAENGTYDHAYAPASVTWNEYSGYDFSIPFEGVTLSIKKVTELVVPEHLNYLLSPAFSLKVSVPGEGEMTIPLSESDLFSIDDAGSAYMSDSFGYAAIWVKDADVVNAFVGGPIFESNSVYISNFFWAIDPDMAGIGMEFTLVAPGERLDGISSVEVNAIIEPKLMQKEVEITQAGQYDTYVQMTDPDYEEYDGMSSVRITVDIPIVPTSYFVQTADELPETAMNGSIAIVLGGTAGMYKYTRNNWEGPYATS